MKAHWKTLSHNGVCFPDQYAPEGLAVRVRGKEVKLSSIAEEMAYHLAKKKDTPYIKDSVFDANFMKDFAGVLADSAEGVRFEDVDFSELFSKVDREKAAKEATSKERKKSEALVRKERREALKVKYGKAIMDGKEVDIANWMVEPPGLFMGRGQAPLRGRWKPRVKPSDVVLNLGEGIPVPSGEWKEVVHDHSSMWMAKWVDYLTGKEKYVWLHESSYIQQSRSKAKYDNAARVGANLTKIRDHISRGLASPEESTRQVATVCYLIDRLGMRVGDEKDEDEADTVGASTLRVEHIRLENESVEFSFLGKDSVQWNKRDSPPPSVLRNLRAFTARKPMDAEIFHHVSSEMVNEFLSSIVKGVTAKVFRTYHATSIAESSLRSKDLKGAEDLDKLYHAKEANLDAAKFCNHQRTPPKTWDQSYQKKVEKLQQAKASGKGEDRVRKLEMELDFYTRTKSYNLNTSLKNYIDPRVYKSWCEYVGLEWSKIYSKSLQRKFSWVEEDGRDWAQTEPVSPLPVSGRGTKSP